MLPERFPDDPLYPVTLSGQLKMFLRDCQPKSGMSDGIFNAQDSQAAPPGALTLTKNPGKLSRATHFHGSAERGQVMFPLQAERIKQTVLRDP